MSNHEEFNRKVDKIETFSDDLKSEIEDMSRLVINEQCLNLARQVDIETEIKSKKSGNNSEIEKLNEQRKKWLAEIKEYEAESVKDMEATRGILIESIEESKKWAAKMRDFERYDNFAAELDKQADEHLSKLKTLRHELKGFQFGGRMMLFNEGNPSLPLNAYHSVGSLVIKRLRVPRLLESYFMQKQSASSMSKLFSITFRVLIIYIVDEKP
jgi:hypothetical protein